MKYVYFVSYALTTGFGRCDVTCPREVRSIEDIAALEGAVRRSQGTEQLAIINFQLLRTEPT